jgi:anti-sigma regulatory factor (Ser/Thr protein kinase)
MTSSLVRIDDDTRVAEARRIASAAAGDEGLSEEDAHRAGIIATEIAGNLRKHAQGGEVHVRRLTAQGVPGVEILSVDRGPGMDLDRCLADGFSTAGTPGTGLGAVRRAADDFDAFSQPAKGTVIVARLYAGGTQAAAPSRWRIAGVSAPVHGEEACGDAWIARLNDGTAEILLADGLGHGIFAADASGAAVQAFARMDGKPPAEALDSVHRALRHTRGAAVAIATLGPGDRVRYAGIGNIAGVILGGPRQQFMISHNGTAGLAAKRVQEFEYRMPPEGAIVMHSDGLVSSWSLDPYPGLLRRDAALIAAVLYRDAARGRDDVCVVVAKWSTS